MRDFALGGDDALGGTTINLTDIGDDMGASLLSNIRPAREESTRSVSFNMDSAPAPSRTDSGLGGIQIMEPLDAVPLDIPLAGSDPLAPSSAPQISINRDSGWHEPAPAPSNEIHLSTSSRDPEAERKEKSDLINKLNRLESKGFTISRKYTMDNSLEEIKQEFERLTDARGLETSIKFQRQIMMGLVTGLELMNEKVNPFDWQLKGWSESVHENLEDFDEVFEELYDKYKGKGNMPPEARLMFMLAGSGFMFHMSNSFYRKQMPGIDEIFRQNPGLQRQFSAAAAQAAGPGFGNFMGMAMGPGGGPGAGPQGPAQAYSPPPMPPTGAFYNNSVPSQQMPPQMPQQFAAQEPVRVARREMKGPSGVDDILKTFEEVRRAESEPMFNPFPEAQQQQQQQQQPAFAAVAEMQSVMTGGDDVASMTDGAGRRRKRKAQPIGNTLVLDA